MRLSTLSLGVDGYYYNDEMAVERLASLSHPCTSILVALNAKFLLITVSRYFLHTYKTHLSVSTGHTWRTILLKRPLSRSQAGNIVLLDFE